MITEKIKTINLKESKIRLDPSNILFRLHVVACNNVGLLGKRASKHIGNTIFGSAEITDMDGRGFIGTQHTIQYVYIKKTGTMLSRLFARMRESDVEKLIISYLKNFSGNTKVVKDGDVKIGKVVAGDDTYYVAPYRWLKPTLTETPNTTLWVTLQNSREVKVDDNSGEGEATDTDSLDSADSADSSDNSSSGSSSGGELFSSFIPKYDNRLEIISEDDKIDLEKLFLEKISKIEESNKNK